MENNTPENLGVLRQDCRSDGDCRSGVYNFIKQDYGICASSTCTPGSVIQGISNTSFFCNQSNRWERTRSFCEPCSEDWECTARTCKDAPGCHPGDYRTSCKNGTCTEESRVNECEMQGLVRIVAKEDADMNRDGSCIVTLAQRELITVCAPCGDGTCDKDLESACNCPEDCNPFLEFPD